MHNTYLSDGGSLLIRVKALGFTVSLASMLATVINGEIAQD